MPPGEADVDAGRLAQDAGHQLAVSLDTRQALWWKREPLQYWLQVVPPSGGAHEFSQVPPEELEALLRSTNWDARIKQCVEYLIDRWCDRRALGPLRHILDGWPHNGLTDGFAELREALDRVRAFSRDELTAAEAELVGVVIKRLDRAVHGR